MLEQETKSSPIRVVWTGLIAIFLVTVLCVWSMFRPQMARKGVPAPSLRAETLASKHYEETAQNLTDATTVKFNPPKLPRPHWIWKGGESSVAEEAFFRRTFQFKEKPNKLILRYTCDNDARVFSKGVEIDHSNRWESPRALDVIEHLDQDQLTLVIHARNEGGPAGLLVVLDAELESGSIERFKSDESWEVDSTNSFSAPESPLVLGEFGCSPWGELAGISSDDIARNLSVAEDFEVELVYAVPANQGSWVSLAVDDKGRIIAGSQYHGLYRVSPQRIGETVLSTHVEPIDSEIGDVQGLLFHQGDLYAIVNGDAAEGSGLYRLRDEDGDDAFDAWEFLRAMDGDGEHGPHSIALGPDGLLYIIAGNHTKLPEPEKSALPRHWGEDHLLPRLWDANGHAKGIKAPGGWVCRTDFDGKTWELVSAGYRNPYDMAFNRDGELFVYDADMEWDMGTPWYRPTRLVHAVSGGEYGWRAGTGKWPTYYPDSLPPTADVGPGSPTGLVFGYDAHFPKQYRDSVYLLDWTFGTIHRATLQPQGSTYSATVLPFLSGRPLPLTDAVINPADGCFYFAVGGRNVSSALYRIRYVGKESFTQDEPEMTTPSPLRETRHLLESLHTQAQSDENLETLWTHLGDPDRFIRYAARTALEFVPKERWSSRALSESDVRKSLASLLALVRCEKGTASRAIVQRLTELPWDELTTDHKLEWLRCLSLSFIRLAPLELPQATRLRRDLEDLYPSNEPLVNREICDLLVYLNSSKVVARSLSLMEELDRDDSLEIDPQLLSRNDSYGQAILKMADALPNQQQMHFALALRKATRGWTHQYRERYFSWFQTAKQMRGGHSFGGFLDVIRDEALEGVPLPKREELARLSQGEIESYDGPLPQGPGHAWTVDEIVAIARNGLVDRDFENGRQLFQSTQCARCHRFSGTGQLAGPDLTAVGTRFTRRDIIESIVEPSKTISDQYAQTEFLLNDDSIALGRVINRENNEIQIITNLLDPKSVMTLPSDRISEEKRSPISPMIPGLIDRLNRNEVLDLLAYLLAEGDSRSSVFLAPDSEGFISMHDGKTLNAWSGNSALWSVEDGVIVGKTSENNRITKNTFLIWQGGNLKDFEMLGEVQLIGDNNSGIQYRSKLKDDFGAEGYQCDIHPNSPYNGMLYEEGGRGILAEGGSRVRLEIEKVVDVEAKGKVTPLEPGWNTFKVIAKGNRLEHYIGGKLSVQVEDNAKLRTVGSIALQVHAGPYYEVRFRNLRIKRLP